jgi:hypothetical protein
VAPFWVLEFRNFTQGQCAEAVDDDFPHCVDTIIPLGDLGNSLDAMYDFHAQHGTEPKRGHGLMLTAVLFGGVSPIRFWLRL